MERTREELQHIFESKIDRLEDLVKEAMTYDIESEKRMMIAIDIAVSLRTILGSSNGGTLISKIGCEKEIIFPFHNATEPFNLVTTYLLVAITVRDNHITFASEVPLPSFDWTTQ